jgi:hypothetical protein
VRPLLQVLIAALLVAVAPSAARAEDSPSDVQARWIAGVAPLPAAAPSGEWKTYAQGENDRWQLGQARLKAMQEWSSRELGPLLPADHAVFYPFAGADALHAIALFGAARRVVLVGLEPVGSLPDPAREPPAGFFVRLGAAQADLHRLTFFRTREMSTDFQREGVLASLVATIVRLGGKVTSVQSTSVPPAPGARVEWVTSGGQPRRLDYVQADLSNAGLKLQAQLAESVHALAPYVTFVKAAMYLLAEARFSSLRQAILDDSAVVVQDDTGVPVRHFDDRWAMRFFGRYEAPGSPFEAFFQPHLRDAFDRRAVTALPFGIGYHVQPQRSHLVVASKGRR